MEEASSSRVGQDAGSSGGNDLYVRGAAGGFSLFCDCEHPVVAASTVTHSDTPQRQSQAGSSCTSIQEHGNWMQSDDQCCAKRVSCGTLQHTDRLGQP
jgi:hypothetical protein